MKIIIEKIDTERRKAIGFTPMDSYPVRFASATFQGWARFVPGMGNPQSYLHQEVEVEIDHEAISGLRIVDDQEHEIVPLAEEFGYHVRGQVTHSKPKGGRTIYVTVGESTFLLSLADMHLIPCEGAIVEFDVHGVSLWDESI